jgi:hypothetical protein
MNLEVMLSRRAAVVFGIADVVTASLVVFGVFVGLPSRWPPVDGVAFGLTALLAVSGAGLLAGAAWSPGVARAASAVSLAIGLGLVSVLAVTASWLSGVYGPVGRGGAVVLALVAALALPYLIVIPVVRLVWLRERGTRP